MVNWRVRVVSFNSRSQAVLRSESQMRKLANSESDEKLVPVKEQASLLGM